MGDVADDMMDEELEWEIAETCDKHGKYIERGLGCPCCEEEAETGAKP